jgi:hypothetical protein
MSGRVGSRWCIAVALLLATLAPPAVGTADAAQLTLAAFAHCPVEDPAMLEHEGGLCVFARSNPTSTLGLGRTVVPLTRAIVLQGGTWLPGAGATVSGFVAPVGVPTIIPVAEPIPGGLPGSLDPLLLDGGALARYMRLVRAGVTRATATIELAAPAGAITASFPDLLGQRGVALVLPIKVRLRDPTGFLGSHCYVGSDRAPIWVRLTDGVTEPPPPISPISGARGQPSENRAEVVTLTANRLVENAFGLPGMEGCGEVAAWAPELDAAVDAGLGLPAIPGTSSAVLEDTFGAAAGSRVAAVDRLPSAR